MAPSCACYESGLHLQLERLVAGRDARLIERASRFVVELDEYAALPIDAVVILCCSSSCVARHPVLLLPCAHNRTAVPAPRTRHVLDSTHQRVEPSRSDDTSR
jgi:hypothetical protein